MSAAIQLVNQALIEAEPVEKRLDIAHNNVSLFELAHEQRLRRALSYIAELQAEVRTLREELARAERTIAQNETLLRNAMIREQELRTEMFKNK
ncbi:MAG: hypothetical protein JMDDDDMK_00751 [Acidobacteria bacterium]|nr:hypothetical protein [Acidobacteriota bacterium]